MKKALIIILTFICAAVAAQPSSRHLYYDKLTDTYLCTIPKDSFRTMKGALLPDNTAQIEYTFLPIVQIKGNFGYEYSKGTVTVEMPDDTESQYELYAKIKWRGGTTNATNKHKRNYSIKFLNDKDKKQDRKFFGLRNDNHWILDAGQMDRSRVRNRIANNLWADFARKPYYYDQEPKARTATRGEFVELFLNDEYRGIYCLMENIDRSQLKLMKYDDDGIHGQLWKGGGTKNANMWNYTEPDNYDEAWGGLETKYPDIDDVCPTDYSTIYNFVKFVADATDEDFDAHITEYIDMPAVVDYFVMVYTLAGIDNYAGKNMFWACYDKQTDKKLTIVPWDLDCTVGNHFNPDSLNAWEIQPTTHTDEYWALNLFYRLDSRNVAGFSDQCRARYNELRDTHFSTKSLIKRYTEAMDRLADAGAYKRDSVKWSGDSDLFYRTLSYETERQDIADWLTVRLQTIDNYGFPTGIRPVIRTESRDNKLYNLNGQRINAPVKGINIINGKKFIR